MLTATNINMNNGKRIIIRHKRMSDAKEDYAWQTDPELAKLDAALILNVSYQQFLSEYTFELCYPSSNRIEFAIETLSGEHIGNCVYYNVNVVEAKAELGIMIGNRQYWNNGYGVEAIESLLDHIFNRVKLDRVYLTTLDWNIRAQKCFQKCGFSPCGEVQRDGSSFILMVIYRIEWEALRTGSSSSENTSSNCD
jgi:ribosomal-protein-alanine N-acetyltransferase